MSSVRLLVLGMLNGWGPMHGHRIRRQAESMNVEDWGEISTGSLYNALQGMHESGLIERVRTEQEGKLPSRTVFAITAAGRQELESLLDRTLQTVTLRADPFDVALAASFGSHLDELPAVIAARQEALNISLRGLVSRRSSLGDGGRLTQRAAAIFRHWERRIESELEFHNDLAGMVPALVSETEGWASSR